MIRKIATAILLLSVNATYAQKLEKLTVEKIMRNPKWMGIAPDNIRWSDDSKKVYFTWNPDNTGRDATYYITPADFKPQKISDEQRRTLPPTNGTLNKLRTLKLYEKNSDLFLLDIASGAVRQLTNTVEPESNPRFNGDETRVIFTRNDNLFSTSLKTGELIQLTNFTKGNQVPAGRGATAGGRANSGGQQEKWLRTEQSGLFEVLRGREADKQVDDTERKAATTKRPKEISLEDKVLSNLLSDPTGRYVTYRLFKSAEGAKTTIVPSYVTASGFTEDIPNRTKVGAPQSSVELFIYDTQRDTAYSVSAGSLPGIKDIPEFVKEYPKQLEETKKLNADRKVNFGNPVFNADGSACFVTATSLDNKDRWIMKLDPASGKMSTLDRQHDEAWIGGPGISNFGGAGAGWISNSEVYFQSEASGYSHLYTVNVATGAKKALTKGKWEVQTVRLSNDKKTFYFTANIEHPGITHLYSIPVSGGTPLRITSMKGGNDVTISPDEKWVAIRYSYSNKPWELYMQPLKAGAAATQITHSTSEEFKSYAWRDPQMISFKNRYGADVYARLYQPANPDPAKPAVIFVHGAGYLQNVHFWWSQYFREYMFNNLLADNGYTVLDIDYTGSSGYGRDHRTGIYRHMGGKDLTDQVDGVKLLVEKYGVNPKNIGLYGGSYGGFITLMALFTEPDVFKSGGALRSVTDWAHYNHGYTSNILNEPFTDEKAYQRSSPINFAAGLKGNLLMCHGMIDVNVNFQDIVRLSQRLIELQKDNWELAVYPLEDHGFVEPSSWTDEYKRIFKLFEETLKK